MGRVGDDETPFGARSQVNFYPLPRRKRYGLRRTLILCVGHDDIGVEDSNVRGNLLGKAPIQHSACSR